MTVMLTGSTEACYYSETEILDFNSESEMNTLSYLRSRSIDPVSSEVREAFQVAVFFAASGLTSLFGTLANIVNIAVFVKQGFKDSINVSLLGLAVADLGCVLTMLWMSLSFSPLFMNSDLPFNPLEVVYVTGGWPHVYFNRVTSLITAFITVERCLCISLPLKVKSIITHTRTKIIISSIFLSAVLIFSPMFYVNQLEWRFNKSRNRTHLTLVFTDDRFLIESITLPIYSVAMSGISLLTVMVCTFILVFKLKDKTKWRQASVAHVASTADSMSTRDKKVLKMVTLISLIFITCYTPATINFFLMAYAPDFSLVGQFANIFFVVWSFTLLIEAINSSVNILVYFNMSSKFRATFLDIFCCYWLRSGTVVGDGALK